VDQSVQDYTEEFYQLLSRAQVPASEKQLVARYVRALKPMLQDELALVHLWDMNEAYQTALKAEQKLKRFSFRLEQGNPSKASKGKVVIGTPRNTSLQYRQVPNKDNANTSMATTRNPSNTCFRCGEMGHRAFECPKKKLHLLDPMEVEEEVDEPKFDSDQDDDSSPWSELHADEGESLVFRRVLTAPKSEPT
ncbi:hypothetical protein AMTR_s00069p00021470, partial [Amborella trichopoda]